MGLEWKFTAEHVEAVWGTMWKARARSGFAPDPLEFGSAVGRHVLGCGQCSRSVGMALWAAALGSLGLDDVLRALGAGGGNGAGGTGGTATG